MPDLDERIRLLFDSPRPVSLDELLARRATGARAPGRWHHRIVITAAVAVVFVGVIGLVVTRHSTTSSTRAPAPVEIRLVLDRTRVTAGTPIRGEALLTNTTGKAITVETCAINGWLGAGLTNDKISWLPAYSAVGCRPTVQLSPGLNRFPIIIGTVFEMCTSNSHTSPQDPACVRGGTPPLPPGLYVTKMATVGLPAGTQLPPGIKVTLTAAAVGTVDGRIIQVGGPSGAPSISVRGVVTLRNLSSGVRYRATANGTSGYSIKVPPGTYNVTGSSLQDFDNGHEMSASAGQPVHVRAGTTSDVNLYIQIS
jgi:hypothetical protein